MTDSIPVIDIGPALAGAPGALDRTARLLRHACEEIGFLAIVDHGVPAKIIEDGFAAAAAFHAQPLAAKLALSLDERMQGYLPYRGSTARSNALNAVRKPNENEAFFVLPEHEGGNRWPADLPAFAPAASAAFEAFQALALRLLPLYARALDLPAEYFGRFFTRPHSSLRMTHYPAVAYGEHEYGLAPHTDTSFITLLAANARPGLQVCTRTGAWIDVAAVPGSFIVNTGDMLHRWSNGRFLSTPHRAVNPGGGPRYAIPYFFHPDLETQLAPLPGCVSAGEPARFEPQTVSEFMAHFRRSNYERFRAADAAA